MNIRGYRLGADSIMEAFLYMLKDAEFKIKYIIAAIFLGIASFLGLFSMSLSQNITNLPTMFLISLLSILSILLLFIYIGYWFSCIRYLRENKTADIELPPIEQWKNFITAFKFFIASVLFGGTITISLIPIKIPVLGLVYGITLGLLILALGIFYTIYFPALIAIFTKIETYTIYFKITNAFNKAKKAGIHYYKTILILALLSIGIGIIISILNYIVILINNIFLTLLAAAIMGLILVYLSYVTAYLIANCINLSDKR